MRNSNRNSDLIAMGVIGLIGLIAYKALSSPSRPVSTRARALPAPRREFVVLYSTHGSEFRFGTADNELPAGPHMTFDEAAAVAERFETGADIIEGRACVFDVRNAVKFSPYPSAAAQ